MKSYIFKTLLLFLFLAFTSSASYSESDQLADGGDHVMIMPKSENATQVILIPSSYVKTDNSLSVPLLLGLYDMEGNLVYKLETTSLVVAFPDLDLPTGNYQLLGEIGDFSFKKNYAAL